MTTTCPSIFGGAFIMIRGIRNISRPRRSGVKRMPKTNPLVVTVAANSRPAT